MFPAARRFFAFSALAFLVLRMPGAAAQQPPKPPPQQPPEKNPQPPPKNVIRGEGCVQAGVQPHCLVLRDVRTGHVYNLLFKLDRPPMGLGIEFSGVAHPGPNTCMQGTAVDVATWAHKESIRCAPGQAGKRGRAAVR